MWLGLLWCIIAASQLVDALRSEASGAALVDCEPLLQTRASASRVTAASQVAWQGDGRERESNDTDAANITADAANITVAGVDVVALATQHAQVVGDHLLRRADAPSCGSKALGLITVAVGTQTAMSAGVFVVVFLLIVVPVGIAAIFLIFIWTESKGPRQEEAQGAKDPLLPPREAPPSEATLNDVDRSRRSRPSGSLRGSGKWSRVSSHNSFTHSHSQRSSRTRNSNLKLNIGGGPPHPVELPEPPNSPSVSSIGSSALCSELVVQRVEGITLLINGQFEPYPQEEIVDICNTDNSSEAIIRALVSETGKDKGVLLESALRFPIAFLHTGAAVGPKDTPIDAARNAGRQVMISRASAFTERAGCPQETYFAVAKAADSNTVVLTRGGDVGGPVMLTAHTRVGTCNMTIADAAGKLIAALEPRRNSPAGGQPQHILHVEHDVDVALVLCAAISAVKLRSR